MKPSSPNPGGRSLPPLLASCWTTAGDAAPGRPDERSPVPLHARLSAAAQAGFSGVGLVHADLVSARDALGYEEIRRMLDAYGIERLELEFLTDWWTQDARRTASDTVRRELLEAAAELGAQHVKAGPERGHDRPDVPRWAAEFAQLAADADAVGARVSLEFLPMFNVPALDDALEIVRSAAHPAGGVLLDIWHVRRSGTPRTAIERLPAALIAGVELNDASAHPLGSLWTDTVDHRRLPGDGDLDVPAFITAVRRTGWQGTWGVEILSAEHRRRPVADAVCDAFAASARQFALADHTATAGPSVGPDPPGPV